MIRLSERSLSPNALASLASYQAQIDAKPTYAEQVEEAARLWKTKNRMFSEVVNTLVAMCPGTRRCCYCEDARGDDVEHFRPKTLYPEVAFAWENYLLACSVCNSHAKRNQFAVIDSGGVVHDVTRAPKATVTPPLSGDPALINPRFEDPLYFLRINLITNFYFLPRTGLSDRDYLRAEYTIKTLRLNQEADLVQWRTQAYRVFIGWVYTYQRYLQQGHPEQLQDHVTALSKYPHLAVWEEMKRTYRERDRRWDDLKNRYRTLHELDALFSATPELLEIGV